MKKQQHPVLPVVAVIEHSYHRVKELPEKFALRHKDLRQKMSPVHRMFVPSTSDRCPRSIGSVSPVHRTFIPSTSDRTGILSPEHRIGVLPPPLRLNILKNRYLRIFRRINAWRRFPLPGNGLAPKACSILSPLHRIAWLMLIPGRWDWRQTVILKAQARQFARFNE